MYWFHTGLMEEGEIIEAGVVAVEQQRARLDLLGDLIRSKPNHPAFESLKEFYEKTRTVTRR